ncbi:cohesin domain-containing protein [Paenibacillus sp. N3.4]|uniref:cohesin domain-containing protein n=1 Tax=Paenibacillus sp. N3.4 TaxID=2603222 RepID=UPI0011C6FF97|nr:cohesin domain-containing protein [Paenibacillus sp. N3.4]TXK80328.1 hypothetical protein FU659_18565 [Paenibacillus sp. N3.4]
MLVFTDGYIATQSGPTPSAKVGDTLQAVGLAGKYSDGTRIRVRDTKELIVTEKGDSLGTALKGTNNVITGGSFDLTFGLTNVTSSLYAQDITFTYDPDLVEFVSADSVRNGFQLVDKKEKEGEIRFIGASFGDTNAVNSSGDLLVLHWKAKNKAAQTTSITISNMKVSNGEVGTQVKGTSFNLQILMAADKSALNALMTSTQNLYNTAVEGTKIGQYPVGTKAVLLTAINNAKTVSDNQNATQQQVDDATVALNAAKQTFTDSVIKPVDSDKSALNALMTSTQNLYNTAVEGTKIDQYPVGTKAALLAAINNAKIVSDNEMATQQQVDQAVVVLNAAKQTFTDSVIKPALGDVNRDGEIDIADLGIVAKYYGKTSADPNWNTYKIADVNNDGKVDIQDLAIVARKILESK